MLLCDKAVPAGWRHTRGSQRARSPQRRARLLFAVRPQGGAVRLGPRRRAPPLPRSPAPPSRHFRCSVTHFLEPPSAEPRAVAHPLPPPFT